MPRRRYEDDDDDDRPRSRRRYDDEYERPRSRASTQWIERRKRRKKSMKLPLILGGAFVLIAVIVLIIVFSSSGKDAAKITVENFERVKPGQTIEEVEKILGSGSGCSEGELQGAFSQAFEPLRGGIELAVAQMTGAERFYSWRGNDLTIFVGFARSESGVERVAYSTFLRKNGGVYEVKQGVRLAQGMDNLDEVARKRHAENKVIEDPKWKKGEQQLARLVVGEWCNSDFQCGRFYANGTYETVGGFGNLGVNGVAKGTYRIAGPQKIDIFYTDFPDFNNRGPTSHLFTLLIADEELMLVKEFGGAESYKQGPYYRIRPDGGGLGKTKVLDPILKMLKSKTPGERDLALFMLPQIGPTAGPMAPALLDMLKKGDFEAQETALKVMATFGSECRRVLPTLIAMLRDAKHKNIHEPICEALSKMGPAARDALPALQEVQAQAGVGTALFALSTDAINKISGRY